MNSSEQLNLINFIKDNSINRTQNLLNESATSALSDAVLDRIFVLTVGKYNKIDFSDIDRTRGDITRLKYFDNLKECINVLLDLHTSTDKIPGALTVSIALENIIQMKPIFERGYRVKNHMAMVIYSSYVYAIMEATSYLIATSVDYVKSDEDKEYSVNLYSDSKQQMLVDQIVKMNKLIEDGSLRKFIGEIENTTNVDVTNEGVSDAAISALFTVGKAAAKNRKAIVLSAAVIMLAINIVPIVREFVYWIYRCRQKISDAAALQAEFLETNIQILKSNQDNDKIIARQERHIKRFKSIARTFAIDSDKAERDAKKDIIDDKVDASAIII